MSTIKFVLDDDFNQRTDSPPLELKIVPLYAAVEKEK